MPTGYTAGILDGSITSFQQFAKLCVRNFGAAIHMRDENFNVEYTPRVPSDYHAKGIVKAKELLESAKSLTDDEILSLRKAKLIEDKQYQLKHVEETKKHRELLNSILVDANKYQIPTKEHEGIKNFMIQQLTETIRFDGDTGYGDNRLLEIEKELFNLSADKIRKEMIDKAEHDFSYHTTEQNKELKRCQESNEWVRRYFESIGIV